MQYLGLLLAIASTLLITSEAKTCETFMDCGFGECCKNFGLFKRCADLRDEGESCGGNLLCGCKIGYTCKPRDESVWNALKIGEGTCVSLALYG